MPGTYFITDTGNTVVHVNADDLHGGTARIGPVWNVGGAPPFNLKTPATPANNVGPFSDSNYFQSTKPNFWNTLVTGPFLGVIIYSAHQDFNPVPTLYFDSNTRLQLGTPNVGNWSVGFNSSAVVSTGANVVGGITVVFFGVDSAGNAYSRVNGGLTTVVHTGTVTANSNASTLGANGTPGNAFSQGVIYEFYLSSDTPSDSAFTTILAEIASAMTYAFRTPLLAKVNARLTAMNYYVNRYDTRVVRYAGSLQALPITNPLVQSVVATPGQIAVSFSAPIVLAGSSSNPDSWTVTAPVGNYAPVSVSAVSLASNVVNLSVGEMTGGASYTLHLPQLGIFATVGEAFTGPFQEAFTGVGTGTPFVVATGLDERSAQVVFSKPVIESDALNPANWSISPNIGITAVTAVTATTYILTTGPQTTGTSYLVTATNIRDTAFNPI